MNTKKMRGCLLLIGESFRIGSQGSRVIHETAIPKQMDACKSHLQLVNTLLSKNIEMNVVVVTYSTPYNPLLQSYYDNINAKYIFIDGPRLGYAGIVKRALRCVCIEPYDFLLLLRVDLLLSDLFTTVYNPFNNRITFPSICMKDVDVTTNRFPQPADTMFHIPCKFFETFVQCVHIVPNYNDLHIMWEILCRFGHLTYESLDTMVPTYHDSDSEKDYNPLYTIINRPRRNQPVTPQHILFDKYDARYRPAL